MRGELVVALTEAFAHLANSSGTVAREDLECWLEGTCGRMMTMCQGSTNAGRSMRLISDQRRFLAAKFGPAIRLAGWLELHEVH